jgi:very-short-patch-repair endonuclease
MESLVRARLLAAGLPKPEVNVVLHHDDGRYLATPDLLYRAAGVAIEYEGAHHLQRGQFEHDVARDRSYAEAGIRVVRVSARDVLVLHRELTDHIAALLGL